MLTLITSVNSHHGMMDATPSEIEHFIGTQDGLSRSIASFILRIVDWILGIFGLDHNIEIVTFFYAAVVLAVSLIVGYIAQWVILGTVRAIARRWDSDIYRYLTGTYFFHKACRLIPPLVFLILIQFTLSGHDTLAAILTKITLIYIVYLTGISLSALIMAVWKHIDERENKRKLPLKGLAQLAKGIVWIIAAIIVVGIIIDRSPASLLAGLGVFASVLMLVFKDSILGLVAGVQLSENDSLHVGDWIKVDGTDANGTVEEVTLVSVKVVNWDKTTTTLPPYSLISGSFTNYRSMQQSHTRRICRSYMIDADSVLPSTPEMLDNLRKLPYMDHYISLKLKQKADGHVADVDNPDGLVNGTIDTNLGLFRAYMKMWLDANPHIAHDSDCFVSTLPQTPTGIPFQIYCFTATSAWFPYEAIQDTIFEHIAAMLPQFQLYAFEYPSSRDTVASGYLNTPNADIDQLFGIPYPFFQSPDAPDSPASTRPTVPSHPAQPSQAAPATK